MMNKTRNAQIGKQHYEWKYDEIIDKSKYKYGWYESSLDGINKQKTHLIFNSFKCIITLINNVCIGMKQLPTVFKDVCIVFNMHVVGGICTDNAVV